MHRLKQTIRSYFQFGPLQPRRVAARWCAFLAIVAAIAAYNCEVASFHDLFQGSGYMDNFVVRNWGVAFIFVEAALLLAVQWLQRGMYWLWWVQFKDAIPTKRQQEVRGQVYGRAYTVVGIIALLWGPSIIVDYTAYAEPVQHHMIVILSWIVGLLFMGLPSILAAWHKDS